MSADEIKNLLEEKITEAEQVLTRLKKAYSAYMGNENTAPLPAPSTQTEVESMSPPPRTDIAPLVNDALRTIPAGENFKTEDVYQAIGRDDLDYSRIRTGLSSRLSRLAQDGKIEKVARGIFRKPIENSPTTSNAEEDK